MMKKIISDESYTEEDDLDIDEMNILMKMKIKFYILSIF